jgi:Domain of unknown function (DUF4126)
MDPLSTIALAAGLGWASGVRFYAVLFFLGVLHHAGGYALPADLQVLAHPWVMAVSGLLFFFEFFADKLPGIDSLWDAVNTFVRIPGGALLAAASVADGDPGLALAAGLLGGLVAAGSHFTKAGSRALINASPEPVTNWAASFTEDALSLAALWLAIQYPLVAAALVAAFLLLALWLMPKLWRALKRLFGALRQAARPA